MFALVAFHFARLMRALVRFLDPQVPALACGDVELTYGELKAGNPGLEADRQKSISELTENRPCARP